MEAVEPADCGFKIEFEARDLELLYEIDGPGEENLPAILVKAKPIAEARWLFQPPGSPNNSSFVPFSSQASLAAMALI